MRSLSKTVAVSGVGVACAVLLLGCSPEASAPGTQTAASPSAVDEGTPSFHGSFAAEYKEAWEQSGPGAARLILEDETITDQEWAQVLGKLEGCLEEAGIVMNAYNPDGSYEVNVGEMAGDIANEKMGACERESGEAWIGYLYRSQTTNPNNVPATQLLTDCMIRNGAVPPSYTEEQYLLDAPELAFPFIDEHGFAIFDSCNSDFSYNK